MGVVDTGGVAAMRRLPPAMPCDVVDLSPAVEEALSRVPFVRVGPDCATMHSCGHARLGARRSPRRRGGAGLRGGRR